MSKKHSSFCPECDSVIEFHNRPAVGFIVKCRKCYESFEVISLKPIELDWLLESDTADDDEFAYDTEFDSEDDLNSYASW